ncbi:hypothetical protein BK139_12975 [Paenibacillus sp. FSL R5-0490]|nr:hypothetical protein BK139_12975 [Paenibacillus sp. FSL R5-0490]
MNIIKKYSDIGYSGASLERPELLEMLNDLKLSQVDYLLVFSVDRFGRDLVNNIDTMLEILDLVKHVVFITESFSSSSEYFKMFFLILTAISQEERERLLSRVKEGRRVKVLIREAYDGKYPLGYVKMASSEVISPVNEETSDDLSKIQEIHILKYIFKTRGRFSSFIYKMGQDTRPTKESSVEKHLYRVFLFIFRIGRVCKIPCTKLSFWNVVLSPWPSNHES